MTNGARIFGTVFLENLLPVDGKTNSITRFAIINSYL